MGIGAGMSKLTGEVSLIGATDSTAIGNVGDRLKVTTGQGDSTSNPIYTAVIGASDTASVGLSWGGSLNVPAWPGVRPLNTYIVPPGKTLTVYGIQYRTASNNNYFNLSSRKKLWSFATALAAPSAPTLTAKTLSGSGLTAATRRYKITAVSNNGETTPGAEASITLTGGQNATGLSWTAVTNASYYRVYRTAAGGATNTETLLLATELTAITDTSPDAELDTITPPVTNTSGGSSAGQAFPSYSFGTACLVDTISAITTPTPLDIVYKNQNDQYRYISATPQAAIGDQTPLGISNTLDPASSRRIPQSQWNRHALEVGVTQVLGVGNNPATGAYNIYGYQHFVTVASPNSGQYVTFYLDVPVVFSAGAEVVLSISSNSKSSTATRNDANVIGFVS